MTAADAILCRLADHHVSFAMLPALMGALAECTDADGLARCVAAHASPAAPGTLADAGWITSCYRHDDVPAILAALLAHPDPDAQAAARRIGRNCPTSLVVALRALRQGRVHARLEPCLEQEYRLASGMIRRHDFVEGVRAAVVDKDRAPVWRPAALAEVDPAEIDALFGSVLSLGLGEDARRARASG
jgi:enoyl-CoA hydratase